jgi:drug/metabolite transporter (DMT)-like permease
LHRVTRRPRGAGAPRPSFAAGNGRANALALAAVALWATLASLGVALAHVPPFLLTGVALVIGSVPAWPLVARWRVPPATLALGVYGLFGFHLLLFLALRHAPPLEANLVNYLWPLGIVVLAPLVLPGVRLAPLHVAAALLGCAGAALAIAGGRSLAGGFAWGYVPALGSALIWATYSLGTRRVAAFPTAAVGLFALVSGLLALACHALLEPRVALAGRDWALLAATGLGPLGAAFYLWDAALKRGDPRQIGTLAYATPLLSTLLLAATTGLALGPWTAVGGALIVGAAVLGVRARAPAGAAA